MVLHAAPSSTFVGPEIPRFVTLRYCATRVLSRCALKAMALERPPRATPFTSPYRVEEPRRVERIDERGRRDE